MTNKAQKSPLFSVITVCYNSERCIEKTIKSVLSQSCKDFEYVIVDGGSGDRTVSIVKSFEPQSEGRLKWISEKDNGIYYAMNKGIGMSYGDWLIFMNAGDVFASDKTLEETVNDLDNSQIVHGNMLRVDNVRKVLTRGAHGTNLDAYDFLHASFCHQATFIRKQVFDDFGGYSTEYKLASDAEFFFRMIIQNKVSYKYVDKTIAIFENGGASTKYRKLYDEERKEFLMKALGENLYNRLEELYVLKQSKYATKFLIKYYAGKTFFKRIVKHMIYRVFDRLK